MQTLTMSLQAFDFGAQFGLPLALSHQEQPAAPVSEQPVLDPLTIQPGGPTTAPGQRPPDWLLTMGNVVPLILLGVLFYFLIVGGGRKREKVRQEQLSTLSRGDRVTTIGGIIGNVVDASGDEIVLKIDENNNTKVRILRSAVANVLKSEAGEKKS